MGEEAALRRAKNKLHMNIYKRRGKKEFKEGGQTISWKSQVVIKAATFEDGARRW